MLQICCSLPSDAKNDCKAVSTCFSTPSNISRYSESVGRKGARDKAYKEANSFPGKYLTEYKNNVNRVLIFWLRGDKSIRGLAASNDTNSS